MIIIKLLNEFYLFDQIYYVNRSIGCQFRYSNFLYSPCLVCQPEMGWWSHKFPVTARQRRPNRSNNIINCVILKIYEWSSSYMSIVLYWFQMERMELVEAIGGCHGMYGCHSYKKYTDLYVRRRTYSFVSTTMRSKFRNGSRYVFSFNTYFNYLIHAINMWYLKL